MINSKARDASAAFVRPAEEDVNETMWMKGWRTLTKKRVGNRKGMCVCVKGEADQCFVNGGRMRLSKPVLSDVVMRERMLRWDDQFAEVGSMMSRREEGTRGE